MSQWSTKINIRSTRNNVASKPHLPGLLAVILLTGLLSSAHAETEESYSETQLLLLGTPHLNNLSGEASELHYRLSRDGSKPFKGSAIGQVSAANPDGGRDVHYVFNYDADEKSYPKVIGFRSNPIIMFFLEWDLEETIKTTTNRHSKTNLRNKVRLAMWDKSEVEDIEITYKGSSHPAKRVLIDPYRNNPIDDPVKTRRYEFIICDAIPGSFQSLSSSYELDGKRISTQLIYDHIDKESKK